MYKCDCHILFFLILVCKSVFTDKPEGSVLLFRDWSNALELRDTNSVTHTISRTDMLGFSLSCTLLLSPICT